MKLIIFLLGYFEMVYSETIYPNFLKNKSIYTTLCNLLENNIKEPILYNGQATSIKKDFCKIVADTYKIEYREFTFDSFILENPHLNNKNNLLYINDFLIGNGRIFNHF